ncbi:MAG TPA: polyprenyl synthetase family protein, partial [Pseudomonadales bacterium]|nr:polyprenyl synthetase family protein [Pseudomonadales bacterium]
MLSFHQAVAEDFAAVNALIIEQLHSRVALVENIGHYIVDAGGKRLRPLLVLLAARSLGYND